jgi:predicted dienelactone hydrolase
VVLYSHGLGGSREGADAWGEAWAAAGFVVVHLQHAGSDADALREGLLSLRAAANVEQFIARVGDVRFALDEIARRQQAGAAPWRDVRLDAIGLAGHSFGAQTTQALAGQRFRVPGSLADARLKAFIALSPSSHRSRMPVQEQFGAIARPFFAITGSLDGDPFGGFKTGEPRAAVYDGLPRGQRALLWLDGADHMTFAGNATRRIDGLGPFRREPVAAEREPAHHALVARITADWWREHLLGDDDARRALTQPQGLGPMDRFTLG